MSYHVPRPLLIQTNASRFYFVWKTPQMIRGCLPSYRVGALKVEPLIRPLIVPLLSTGIVDVPPTVQAFMSSRKVTLGTTLPEAVSQTNHAFSHRFYSADHRDNYALCGTNHRLIHSYESLFIFQSSKTARDFSVLNN